MKIRDINIKLKASKHRTTYSESRLKETLELIKRIERADKLAIGVSKEQFSEKLQILPGYQTGVVSSLC